MINETEKKYSDLILKARLKAEQERRKTVELSPEVITRQVFNHRMSSCPDVPKLALE